MPYSDKARKREWAKRNADRMQAASDRYRNSPKGKETRALYYAAHKDDAVRRAAEWNARNPERRAEYKRRQASRQRSKLIDSVVRHAMSWSHGRKGRIDPAEWPLGLVGVRRELIKARRLEREIRRGILEG